MSAGWARGVLSGVLRTPGFCAPSRRFPWEFDAFALKARQWALARTGGMWLIKGIQVRLGIRATRRARVAKSALAVVLAALVIVLGVFSANQALHQTLHSDGAGTNHLCLICSFAKGELSGTDAGPAWAGVVFCCLWGVCRTGTPVPTSFDHSQPSSRAPPRA